MKTRYILLVVEGEKTEKQLLDKLFEYYESVEQKYEIISFRTNIYTLFSTLKKDKFIDIKNLLIDKRHEFNISDISEVILIFDLDIHHTDTYREQMYTKEKIIEMLSYFRDEFENGKLIINYPMVESFKDVQSYNEYEYYDNVISVEQSKTYKELVGSKNTIIQGVKGLNHRLSNYLIYINICKKNFILNGEYRKPSLEEFIRYEELELFLKIEKKYISHGKIPILNCLLLSILEYMKDEEKIKFINYVSYK